MRPSLVESTIERYVCAVCWGRLTSIIGPDGLEVVCIRRLEGECNGHGFVTLRYANRRRDESAMELMNVRWHYPELFPAPKRSEADIMKMLGY